MAITTIDPKTALILVDLQKGIVSLPTAHPIAAVLSNARALADIFRKYRLPVVLVNVAGGAPGRTEQSRGIRQLPDDWMNLVPELNQQPTDHTVTKKTWGAFTNTDLAQYLQNLAVTQVVIGGVSTSIGVESTARNAYELGFNVTLAIDAMTDTNSDAHQNSVTRIFPRLGETAATGDILALLASTRDKPST